MQATESEVKGGRKAARKVFITDAAQAENCKNLKWALDSRSRWIAATESLEAKLEEAVKALKLVKHLHENVAGNLDPKAYEQVCNAIINGETI